MNDIYVASSWRNPIQPEVVKQLREAGHSVYDFRKPSMGEQGFRWCDVTPGENEDTLQTFLNGLESPLANDGFEQDFAAMRGARIFILVMPSGRSAHLEAGWSIGAGKPTAILLSEDEVQPELMYKMADALLTSIDAVVEWAVQQLEGGKG